MKRKFFLDDIKNPPDDWETFRTVPEVWDALVHFECDDLSLDNDLGIEGLRNEGQSVINDLVRSEYEDGLDFWPKKSITIHSGNIVARDNMIGMLERYSRFVPIDIGKRRWRRV